MTTQNQIRQAFTHHWCHPDDQAGKNAWLIKGDFDHFKMTNDLYGSLICDYLLDWTLDVIEAQLQAHQKHWGGRELLWNFVGDDVTIYVPPSTLREDDIEKMLWEICRAIEKSFYRRYRVAALPLPSGFFDDIPTDSLEGIRNELESMDVVLDFAGRQRGYLILFPAGPHGAVLESIRQVIQSRSGKSIPQVELQSDWIWDPESHACRNFNDGFLQPPSISFAACLVPMDGDGRQYTSNRRSVYERVSLACHSALKECKQQRMKVYIQNEQSLLLDVQPAYQAAGVVALYSPLRWSSERYLRETLYFREFDQPILFQFNPVYHSNSEMYTAAMSGDIARIERYRGNQYGIGLKGINEIFGHNAADCLIGELTWVFSKVMQSALVKKGIPLESVHLARFVDRFTVCCEWPVFQYKEILELVRRLARLFNCVSDEIKISHLRLSLVVGGEKTVGCRLFNELALTSLSPLSVTLENSNPPIEVRQYSPGDTVQGGSTVLERNSFLSAKMLDTYNGTMSPRLNIRKILFSNALQDPLCIGWSLRVG